MRLIVRLAAATAACLKGQSTESERRPPPRINQSQRLEAPGNPRLMFIRRIGHLKRTATEIDCGSLDRRHPDFGRHATIEADPRARHPGRCPRRHGIHPRPPVAVRGRCQTAVCRHRPPVAAGHGLPGPGTMPQGVQQTQLVAGSPRILIVQRVPDGRAEYPAFIGLDPQYRTGGLGRPLARDVLVGLAYPCLDGLLGQAPRVPRRTHIGEDQDRQQAAGEFQKAVIHHDSR
jgi:hypothetical protein